MPVTEPLVSVVVPVHRNAATLAELLARLAGALSGRRWEVLFVEDACPAGSLTVLRRLTADPRVGVLALARNGGQNTAVLTGLRHSRGEVLVVLDADLQDPPEAIPGLLAALEAGAADVVFAGRRGEYEAPFRLLTGRLFKRVLRALSGGALPADAGLFVALRQPVATRIATAPPAEPYVLGLIAAVGARCESVPVTRAPRNDGPSSYTAAARWGLARRALAAAWKVRRGAAAPPAPEPEIAERLGWAAEVEPRGARV